MEKIKLSYSGSFISQNKINKAGRTLQKEIKGIGNTPKEASIAAREHGEQNPILTKVPKDYNTYIL